MASGWIIRSVVLSAAIITLSGCVSSWAQNNTEPNTLVFDSLTLTDQCQTAVDDTPTRCDFAPELIGDARHYWVELTIQSGDTPLVYAESRRLMSGPDLTSRRKKLSFWINSRQPDGQPIQEGTYVGTPGITIWLPDGLPGIEQITITADIPDKRLFIIGDSTVCDQNPQWDKPEIARFSGWGQVLPAYLNNTLSVVNYADSGEGTFAFNTQDGELFKPIAEQLEAGDMVLIQLGHNDKNTPTVTYEQRISDLVTFIKARGAQPMLVSPMIRNHGISLAQQHQWPQLDVRASLQKLSQQQVVPFIDLMALSDAWVTELGQTPAQQYFVPNDRTHSNESGAHIFASMLVQDVMRQQLPLASYITSH